MSSCESESMVHINALKSIGCWDMKKAFVQLKGSMDVKGSSWNIDAIKNFYF